MVEDEDAAGRRESSLGLAIEKVYERQENALIAGFANGEGLPAVYECLKDGVSTFKSTGFEERGGTDEHKEATRDRRCRGGDSSGRWLNKLLFKQPNPASRFSAYF